ncbi:transposase, partial [bacterium]|nr:transposase [bacterium]MBU1025599.1 transposase [bacterium]
ERYFLLAWVIMPNHVHVLVQIIDGYLLSDLLHSWKRYTAKMINRMLGRKGRLWQREYWDRYIRNENHLNNAINYIHMNPVKAGFVNSPEEWQFSSAWKLQKL